MDNFVTYITEDDSEFGRIVDFANGIRCNCPKCEAPVSAIEAYQFRHHGYAVIYTAPCGCRLGSWGDAPQWARDAGIVTDISPQKEENEPTHADLLEDGIISEMPPEYWESYNKFQEDHGQLRLFDLDEIERE